MILSETQVRVIGVCFGHQIVGRALKAEVGRNPLGWEAAVNDVDLSAKGKELFGVDKLVCCLLRLHAVCSSCDSFFSNTSLQRIHQMHRDCVFYYPEGVEELGSSPVCKVQGMYSPKRLMTVQGHPEFNKDIMREIVDTRHATGIFDDKAYTEHGKKVDLPHDGLIVSQAFLRFLTEK
jgi:GMP synthase-like glutamine amidotransferase